METILQKRNYRDYTLWKPNTETPYYNSLLINKDPIASTVSSSMLGLPDLLRSKMLPVSIKFLNHLLMLLV